MICDTKSKFDVHVIVYVCAGELCITLIFLFYGGNVEVNSF